MAWTKAGFRGFGVNFIDPINSIVNAYVQAGVLAGPHYSASDVSYGLPKPKFLQIEEESDEVTIKTEEGYPLVLCFALGLQEDDGGNEGQWRNLIRVIDPDQDGDGSVKLSETSYIVAVLDEEDEPYPVSYKAISAEGREFYWQRSEPDSPSDGDFWFSVDENWIKEWDDGAAEWKERRYVFLGKVGVGSDGYCYSALSWFPNKRVAEIEADKYPHGENPWSHYDGVSFTTDGEYVASQADQWIGDQDVLDAVTANKTAMQAVDDSDTAGDEFVASDDAMQAIEDSDTAKDVVLSSLNKIGRDLAFDRWMDGDQDDTGIGEAAGGGYAVSYREDILGNKYGLIVAGGEGDSWQREADSSGVPGNDGDGQLEWSADETVVADDLGAIDDSHDGYSDGVVPNRSDLEDKWGSDWEDHFPSSTDGLFNTEVILAYIASTGGNWEDWPAFNFIKHLREEKLGGQDDWYIEAQASSNDFDGDGNLGDVTESDESEMADIFWRLLQGYATDLSEGGNPEDDIPERLYKFFYERPDDESQGSEAFDASYYWSSTEDGSDAFLLLFYSGFQATRSKSYTGCVRACRRVYL